MEPVKPKLPEDSDVRDTSHSTQRASHLKEEKAITRPPRSHKRSHMSNKQEDDQAGANVNLPQDYQKRVEELFTLESQFRQAESIEELGLISVNQSRLLLKFSQAILLHSNTNQVFQVTAISSLNTIDHTAPFITTMHKDIAYLAKHQDIKKTIHLRQSNLRPNKKRLNQDQLAGQCLLWVPLLDRKGQVFAGHLYSRRVPWTQKEEAIATHIAETCAHAWLAMTRMHQPKRKTISKRFILGAILAAIMALFIPVPMTVLAPTEIVAENPTRIAAPIDGVIDKILVEPNTFVKRGTTLFRYVDTDLRSDYELSERQLSIAEARLQRFSQAAFANQEAKSELAIAAAEVDLAKSQKAFAAERLTKIEVKAQDDGLVIYKDKDTWTARPVATGERVMDIANPSNVKGRLDLAVSDAIVLKEGAPVRIFLDTNPLNPLTARLDCASYHAEPTPAGALAYTVDVSLETMETKPRIGMQGVAQLYGDKVSLGFFLFRRPLSALRQYFGI